jgi:hypothetical protein
MRILLATDQPFWHCRGGAQQRMACLWQALRQNATPPTQGNSTLVYYLGDPQEVNLTPRSPDPGPIVSVRSESSPPDWQPWRWISSWVGSSSKPSATRPDVGHVVANATAKPSLTLNDYRWTWVKKSWNKVLHDFRPDVVILEYVTMTYLFDLAIRPDRDRIVWAVDTHDCLSQRAAQFQAAGQSHWLSIGEAEEISALQSADLVIAIQKTERDWFANRLTGPKVIAIGHAPLGSTGSMQPSLDRHETTAATSEPKSLSPKGADPLEASRSSNLITRLAGEGQTRFGIGSNSQAMPSSLRLGFLASNNFPNRHGITNWLLQVAPKLRNCQIVVGGSISSAVSDILNSDARFASVAPITRCLGTVEELGDFYREVDAVICPIELGTGLKIKLVEGLAFHLPVLATPQATENLIGPDSGVVVCETPEDWIYQINQLTQSPEKLEVLRQQAAQFSQHSLTPEVVYGELIRELNELVGLKRPSTGQGLNNCE